MAEEALQASTIIERGMPLLARSYDRGKVVEAEFVPTSVEGTGLVREAAEALVAAGVDPESDCVLMVFEPTTGRIVKWHRDVGEFGVDDYWHVWYPEFGED